MEWQGKARQARQGKARQGKARQARQGKARQGKARSTVVAVASRSLVQLCTALYSNSFLCVLQKAKGRKSLTRQTGAHRLEGRTNLERQSAAFGGQGAEAHWSASLPGWQLSVQHILVQCCRVQLQAREAIVDVSMYLSGRGC